MRATPGQFRQSRSILSFRIDDVGKLAGLLEDFDRVRNVARNGRWLGERRIMRRQSRHDRWSESRTLRFSAGAPVSEYIERCGFQRPVVEGGENTQPRPASHAAPGIEQYWTAEVSRRGLAFANSARSRRSSASAASESNQRDENIGAREKSVIWCSGSPGNSLFDSRRSSCSVRLQPATSKPIRASFSAASCPNTPSPITPMRTSRAAGWNASSSQIFSCCCQSYMRCWRWCISTCSTTRHSLNAIAQV